MDGTERDSPSCRNTSPAIIGKNGLFFVARRAGWYRLRIQRPDFCARELAEGGIIRGVRSIPAGLNAKRGGWRKYRLGIDRDNLCQNTLHTPSHFPSTRNPVTTGGAPFKGQHKYADLYCIVQHSIDIWFSPRSLESAWLKLICYGPTIPGPAALPHRTESVSIHITFDWFEHKTTVLTANSEAFGRLPDPWRPTARGPTAAGRDSCQG
jgi:hypothetical protein